MRLLRVIPAAASLLAAAAAFPAVFLMACAVVHAESMRNRVLAALGWSMDVLTFNEVICLAGSKNPLIKYLVNLIYPPEDRVDLT